VNDDEFGPALVGLTVLGIVIAVLALAYFVWTLYQLIVLGAT